MVITGDMSAFNGLTSRKIFPNPEDHFQPEPDVAEYAPPRSRLGSQQDDPSNSFQIINHGQILNIFPVNVKEIFESQTYKCDRYHYATIPLP